ncbi:MAG: YkgJ family cysteine cluster protein [Bacteriovoracia bacterium]
MTSRTSNLRVSSASADAQRPSTWRKYQKGMCEGCWGGCCTLPVEVSAHDLIRLGLTDEGEVGVSPKALAKRLTKEKVLQGYNPRTGIFTLAQVAGRDCIYLDKDRLCTVYDRRPEVCRQFPKIGPRPGFCPARKK